MLLIRNHASKSQNTLKAKQLIPKYAKKFCCRKRLVEVAIFSLGGSDGSGSGRFGISRLLLIEIMLMNGYMVVRTHISLKYGVHLIFLMKTFSNKF